MKSLARICAFSLLLLLLPTAVCANTTIITFDGLNDSDSVTTQFADLTFSHSRVLTSGISLNEFEFPPKSGSNVVFDDGGPIDITFAIPINDFSAFFTYSRPLTLQGLDAGNAVIATATSLFSTNLAISGNPGSSPNESLHVAGPAGISRILITGDVSGGSFTMDNVTYTTGVASVPEPCSLLLITGGLSGLIVLGRKRS
jgi:hypothetical protein